MNYVVRHEFLRSYAPPFAIPPYTRPSTRNCCRSRASAFCARPSCEKPSTAFSTSNPAVAGLDPLVEKKLDDDGRLQQPRNGSPESFEELSHWMLPLLAHSVLPELRQPGHHFGGDKSWRR